MKWVYFPNKILRQFIAKVLENRKIARKKAQEGYAIATEGSGWRQSGMLKRFKFEQQKLHTSKYYQEFLQRISGLTFWKYIGHKRPRIIYKLK